MIKYELPKFKPQAQIDHSKLLDGEIPSNYDTNYAWKLGEYWRCLFCSAKFTPGQMTSDGLNIQEKLNKLHSKCPEL